LTGNLTSVGTFYSVEYLPLPSGNAIAVGTSLGVFIMRTSNPGAWLQLGSNLPNAPTYDMQYDGPHSLLAVSTVGRGAFTYSFIMPTFLVRSLADSGASTLRDAMEHANIAGCGNSSIAVTGTINLASSLPFLTASVNITGPGTNNLTINGAGAYD